MSLLIAITWTVIYPSVIYFLNKKYLGTAYGVIGASIGLAQCVGPLINAVWIDSTNILSESYKNLYLYYVVISMAPILLSVWIFFRPEFDKMDRPTDDKVENFF